MKWCVEQCSFHVCLRTYYSIALLGLAMLFYFPSALHASLCIDIIVILELINFVACMPVNC